MVVNSRTEADEADTIRHIEDVSKRRLSTQASRGSYSCRVRMTLSWKRP